MTDEQRAAIKELIFTSTETMVRLNRIASLLSGHEEPMQVPHSSPEEDV